MRTILENLCVAVLIAAVSADLAVAQVWSSTRGGDSPAGAVSSELQSAGAAAELAYNSGLRSVMRAREYDAQALKATTPGKAAQSREKAQSSYRDSISAFVTAVSAQPTLYKAWNYLGLADRHVGNYDEALSAYAKVLELNPHNLDAMENRGEVYLALNQIEDAKSSYLELRRESRPRAKELISAIRRWTESRRQDAPGVPAADLEALNGWIDEQAKIATQ